MSQNLTWKDAIVRVLTDEGEAMAYTDIAEQIVERGLRSSLGATPANTVGSIISTSIQNEGGDSLFYRAGRGLYGLRAQQAAESSGRSEEPAPENTARRDEESCSSIIQALGMFWLRSNVIWKNNPTILGRQQIGADNVNLSGQRGVYLLHDRRDVVYVGRSVDRPIGQRLYEHTVDRLNGRWDRFSWFGLLKVNEDGHLENELPIASGDSIIAAFESILIEALEPPQNRRRGDDLNAVEFMQARDPEIDRRQTRDLLQQVIAKME